ncbi:unnamed protein product, partial [Amoebophrya sp. A25]|eukprot:GSA25T00007625001.1
MGQDLGKFAEWGMGDLTTNLKKYDRDKSGTFCPDEGTDAVVEGGLKAAMASLSDLLGGVSPRVTNKILHAFNELLSKWKAKSDEELEVNFSGFNKDKPSSAFPNAFHEKGGSPCID